MPETKSTSGREIPPDLSLQAAADLFPDVLLSMIPADKDPTTANEEPPATPAAGDEAPEAPPPQQAEPVAAEADDSEPETFRLQNEQGEWELVTAEELHKRTLRHADYTRKTQKVAERERELELERASLKADREWLATEKEKTLQALKSVAATEPDWDAEYAADPAMFAVRRAAWNVQQDRLRKAEFERDEAAKRVQDDRQREAQARMAIERRELLEAVPEWKDDAKMRSDFADMITTAKRLGATDQQIAFAAQSKAGMLFMLNATRYDKQQAGNKARETKVAAKIERVKVAAPGGTPKPKPAQTDRDLALAKLKQTGKWQDSVDVLKSIFPDK